MKIPTYSELLAIVAELVGATDVAFDDIEQTGSIQPQNARTLHHRRAAALNAIAIEKAANGHSPTTVAEHNTFPKGRGN